MTVTTVAATVWSIATRPHHRVKWEAWSRPGVHGRPQSIEDVAGAQSSIAWVVEAYRYGEAGIRKQWSVPDSSPSCRSAVQRFFSQGARLTAADPNAPLEKLTRSTILSHIVTAFGFTEAEVSEIRQALAAGVPAGNRHMGQAYHTWDVARSDADIAAMIELSRRVVGGRAGFKAATPKAPTAADIAPLRRRLDTRADALELCLRQHLDDDHETLVGYLLVYPLNQEVTERIFAGRVTGADQIADSEVAAAHAEECSLYIAMVLGADIAARAAVMERCIQRVSRWSAAHPEGRVLAKRSTDDGQRWLENYGFVPITSPDEIWLREAEAPAYRRRKRRLIASVS